MSTPPKVIYLRDVGDRYSSQWEPCERADMGATAFVPLGWPVPCPHPERYDAGECCGGDCL